MSYRLDYVRNFLRDSLNGPRKAPQSCGAIDDNWRVRAEARVEVRVVLTTHAAQIAAVLRIIGHEFGVTVTSWRRPSLRNSPSAPLAPSFRRGRQWWFPGAYGAPIRKL